MNNNKQPLDAAALDKLEALAKAATPGPWMRLFGERTIYDRMEDGCRGIPIVRADLGYGAKEASNLDFIAAANPATILALIAQARAAQPAQTIDTLDFDRLLCAFAHAADGSEHDYANARAALVSFIDAKIAAQAHHSAATTQQDQAKCKRCDGKGLVHNSSPVRGTCPICHGTGAAATTGEDARDAARYRWLRDRANDERGRAPMVFNCDPTDIISWSDSLHGANLDAVLDVLLDRAAPNAIQKKGDSDADQ